MAVVGIDSFRHQNKLWDGEQAVSRPRRGLVVTLRAADMSLPTLFTEWKFGGKNREKG